ncbi:MAG: hypothetical protein ABSB31_05485 [Dehalococcoidia bacterium]|jgi:hypothetical protein
MPIENRNLVAGTKLTARYKKQPYSCEVVEGEGGKLRYRLEDGREFKSPSAAGMAITGHACDGWVFWSVETAEATPAPEARQTEVQQAETLPEHTEVEAAPVLVTEGPAPAAASSRQAPKGRKRIFKQPNQMGVPEGQTRWYCYDCGSGFNLPTGQKPEACPQGHTAA